MKTALDNYERGKQRESNADDYNNYVSYPKGRFICPECGEPVHLRPSKLRSNFFVHYKRTDENEECDRRVDGVQTESIYERLGLPIFIRSGNEGRFNLYIGFRAIPQPILERAEKENVSIIIDNKYSYRVNRERFSSDYSVMIPIKHIPAWGGNYPIVYKNASIGATHELKKYWPNFAEGFMGLAGALFSMTGSGGKKIRHGDNVVTDTEYYWVVKASYSMHRGYAGISTERVGSLVIDESDWVVYKVVFDSNVSDAEYSRLAGYLREKLKVLLIEKPSECVPIWPPMVKRSDGYAFNKDNTKQIFGIIESGNEVPRVYIYRGISTKPEALVTKDGIATVSPTDNDFVINVDRKYSSSGTFFSSFSQEYVVTRKEIEIVYEDDTAYINNLSGYEAVIYRKNGVIEKRTDESLCEITGLSNGDVICIFGNGYLVLCNYIDTVAQEDNQQKSFDVELFMRFVKQYSHASCVSIPHSIRIELKRAALSFPEIAKEIEGILKKNKIAIPLIALLEGDNLYD